MALHGADVGHWGWVLLATSTHAAVGYALVAVGTDARPAYGLVGAVLPDVDLLFLPGLPFPLVHRGLLHTPLAAGLVVLALAAGRRGTNASDRPGRGPAVAVGIGYLSHLVIDSFTAAGVMWGYPASTASYGVGWGIHAVAYDVLLWAAAIAALVVQRSRAAG